MARIHTERVNGLAFFEDINRAHEQGLVCWKPE